MFLDWNHQDIKKIICDCYLRGLQHFKSAILLNKSK